MNSYQNSEEFNDSINDNKKSNAGKGTSVLLGALTLLSILFVIAIAVNPQSETVGLYTSTVSVIDFSVSASSPVYGAPSKILAYLPWTVLVEPYQDQLIQLDSLVVDGADVSDLISTDYTISWEINDEFYKGSPAIVNVKAVGVIEGTVTISYEGNDIASSTFTIASKYIRRELSSLTSADRTLFSRTLRVLYDTPLIEGQSLYGPNFLNAEWFAQAHLNGAGRTDCDHWHDGAAIATTHLALTLLAEKSLQSIVPSLSMPYWEYAGVRPLQLLFSVLSCCLFYFYHMIE